jgi:hypothetical protein
MTKDPMFDALMLKLDQLAELRPYIPMFVTTYGREPKSLDELAVYAAGLRPPERRPTAH